MTIQAEDVPTLDQWRALDRLREQGQVVAIKLDGQRKAFPYTVMLVGGGWASHAPTLGGALRAFLRPRKCNTCLITHGPDENTQCERYAP